MHKKLVNFKDAGLSNHYFFQELFKDQYIFEEVVNEILPLSVGKIQQVISDPKLAGSVYSHDIVCDLLAILQEQTLINLELQNYDIPHFLKRTRYYVSQIQVNYYSMQLKERYLYEGVPVVISIWLCTFENFKYGIHQNTILSYNQEMGMLIEDGIVRIFMDITKYEKFSDKLAELFKFILDSSEENALQAKWDIVKLLYQRMNVLKQDPRKEQEFMSYNKAHETGFELGRMEGQETGRLEGIKQGIEEGIKQGIEEGIKEGIKEGKREGIIEGKREGIIEGKREGIVEGESKKQIETVIKMFELDCSLDLISQVNSLPIPEVQQIIQKHTKLNLA